MVQVYVIVYLNRYPKENFQLDTLKIIQRNGDTFL